jgi:hypothetical protein
VRATTSGTTVTYTAGHRQGVRGGDTARLLRAYKAGFGTGVRRGNLMMHELGHVVGLNHVSNVRLLMNPLLSSYSPKGYAVGDASGLTLVDSRAGCINGM